MSLFLFQSRTKQEKQKKQTKRGRFFIPIQLKMFTNQKHQSFFLIHSFHNFLLSNPDPLTNKQRKTWGRSAGKTEKLEKQNQRKHKKHNGKNRWEKNEFYKQGVASPTSTESIKQRSSHDACHVTWRRQWNAGRGRCSEPPVVRAETSASDELL